jgi:hypothetical protein
MRSALAAVLLVATVACSSVGPSALAESPWPIPMDVGTADVRAPAAATPRVEILDDSMSALPTFVQAGRRFVLGAVGERYRLHISNPTPARVEVVVSIDGLDAIDGRPANLAKRGYLVAPYADVTIDGWRTSLETVAAFRFSSVRASYAARTGRDRNVGVIGVAFFRERPVVVPMPAPLASRAAPASPASPAPKAGAARSAADEARPGLGTEFGESHDSYVTEVPFERASSVPSAVAELRYDDREGLIARGIRMAPRNVRDWENERRDHAQPFPETRFAQPPN